MPVRTLDLQSRSVQEKAFLRVELEPAESQGVLDQVDKAVSVSEAALYLVQIGLLGTPQQGVIQVHAALSRQTAIWRRLNPG